MFQSGGEAGQKEAPSWLDEENDDRHREEMAPLFGSAYPSLQDPPSSQDDDEADENDSNDDEETPGKTTKDYGSFVDRVIKSVSSGSSETETKKKIVVTDTRGANFTTEEVPLPPKPRPPGNNPCLWMFHLIEGIAIVSALLLLVTQLLPLFISASKDEILEMGIASLALRVYCSIYCVSFLITELNPPYIKTSEMLQSYAARGFLYSFMGLISIEQSKSDRIQDILTRTKSVLPESEVSWATVFMEMSAGTIAVVGVLYMIMGLFCLKKVRDRLKQKEKDDWAKYREDKKKWNDLYGD